MLYYIPMFMVNARNLQKKVWRTTNAVHTKRRLIHGRAVHVIFFMWLPRVFQGYRSRKYVSDITLEFEADPQSEAIPFLRLNVQRFILQVWVSNTHRTPIGQFLDV